MRLRVWKWQNTNVWKFNQGYVPKHIDRYSIVEVQYYDGLIGKNGIHDLEVYWKLTGDEADIYMYRVIKY